MPVGMRNMFTTGMFETLARRKSEIGSQLAAILPAVDLEVIAMTTPSVTIQLQRMAFTKAVIAPATPEFRVTERLGFRRRDDFCRNAFRRGDRAHVREADVEQCAVENTPKQIADEDPREI